MARVRRENTKKQQPEQTEELIESSVQEVVQEENNLTEEVLNTSETEGEPVAGPEVQEIQNQVEEENLEVFKNQEVQEQPSEELQQDVEEEPVQSDQNEQPVEEEEGIAYVVKLNRFLSNKLSKYEVRIKTSNGEKKYLKSSRDKACFVANKLNRSKGFQTNLTIIE